MLDEPWRCPCCKLTEFQFSGDWVVMPDNTIRWYCDICLGREHHLLDAQFEYSGD